VAGTVQARRTRGRVPVSPWSVIDLFCGAGGLSAGLESAGWQTVAAVDHDADCIDTLRATQALRLPIKGSRRRFLDGARLVCADVADIAARDLRPDGVGPRWRPGLLVGGPPCQPFSSAGRQRGIEDPRGRLFLEFVRLAASLRPRYILFENVQGLLTAKCPNGRPGGVLRLVQSAFEDIGYACSFRLLNAADYGSPQRRMRLFLLASADRRLPVFPLSTHSATAHGELIARVKPWVTLGDFLATQPKAATADVMLPPASRLADLMKLKLGTGIRATGIVEANRPGGHWGYRQDCFLADPRVPSRTIRAATTPDYIKLADGSLRRLTWRECAGLQGFPPRWTFKGTMASKFRQIGNAIQCDLARALGCAVLQAFKEDKRETPQSEPWPANFHRRVRYTAMEHVVNGAHREAARQRRASSRRDYQAAS